MKSEGKEVNMKFKIDEKWIGPIALLLIGITLIVTAMVFPAKDANDSNSALPWLNHDFQEQVR